MEILNQTQMELIRAVMTSGQISRDTPIHKFWMDHSEITMTEILQRIFTLGYREFMSEIEQNAQN